MGSSKKATSVARKKAADGLFAWLDALWTKKRLNGTPPIYMIHRFLASEKNYAPTCRILRREVREPALIFRIWQDELPRARGAPWLKYPCATRQPDAEALVVRMCEVLSERREVVEGMMDVITSMGERTLRILYERFGVEQHT